MDKIKLTGTVYHVGTTQQVSEKFKKREFVIKTNEQFEQFVLIQVINDRCDLLDSLKFNDLIDVMINIRGREWTDKNTGQKKFFNTLEAWQITFAGLNSQNNYQSQPAPQPAPQPATPAFNQFQQTAQPQNQNNTNIDPLGFFTKNENDPF
jgi:hypothetical protein